MATYGLAQINEIRGLADAFITMQYRKGNWNQSLGEQIRKTCNEICDMNGHVDEDAQPDVKEFELFKSWMDSMVEYINTDSSPLQYIDFYITVRFSTLSHITLFVDIISSYCSNISILNINAEGSSVLNFKISLIGWAHVYKYASEKYKGDNELARSIQELADKLEIANSYFTREFFDSIPV